MYNQWFISLSVSKLEVRLNCLPLRLDSLLDSYLGRQS